MVPVAGDNSTAVELYEAEAGLHGETFCKAGLQGETFCEAGLQGKAVHEAGLCEAVRS